VIACHVILEGTLAAAEARGDTRCDCGRSRRSVVDDVEQHEAAHDDLAFHGVSFDACSRSGNSTHRETRSRLIMMR